MTDTRDARLTDERCQHDKGWAHLGWNGTFQLDTEACRGCGFVRSRDTPEQGALTEEELNQFHKDVGGKAGRVVAEIRSLRAQLGASEERVLKLQAMLKGDVCPCLNTPR